MEPKLLCRVVLYIFNFYNILCFKTLESNLKNSNFLFAKNLLSIPIILILRFFLGISLQQKLEAQFDGLDGMSIFFAFIMTSMTFIYFIVMCFCVYTQLRNRVKILNLINDCVKFYQTQKIDCRSLKTAKDDFLRNFLSLMCLILFLYFLEYFTMLNPSWVGIVFYILFQDDSFFILFYFAFVNCFISYFLFLVKNLNSEMEAQKFKKLRRSSIVKISFDLAELNQLMLEFHEAIGFLLSLVVVFTITAQVLRVKENLISRLLIYLICFFLQLYAIVVSLRGIIELTAKTKFMNCLFYASFIFSMIRLVVEPCQEFSNEVISDGSYWILQKSG